MTTTTTTTTSIMLTVTTSLLLLLAATTQQDGGVSAFFHPHHIGSPKGGWTTSSTVNSNNLHSSTTQLHAFKLKEGQTQNMFEGPMSLVKERDACGVGFIANTQSGEEFGTHKVLTDGLAALDCMEHRGACGGDGISGDGAGIMTEIPWKLFEEYRSDECDKPGVGMMFLPRDETRRNSLKQMVEEVCELNELKFMGWREVPVNGDVLGPVARQACPSIWQFFVQAPTRLGDDESRDGFERTLYLVRRRFAVERQRRQLMWNDDDNEMYVASLSSRTIVYKGMVQSCVLPQFYLDLQSEDYTTKFVIYHRRFSTNTNPQWRLAQPMRVLGHNGEINTLLGNMNWIKAREAAKITSTKENVKDLVDYENTDNIVMMCNTQDIPSVLDPVVASTRSDSANLDGVFELMTKSRHRAPCALMALVPSAYENEPSLSQNPEIVDFYKFHGGLLEAWDGPALLVYSDGKSVGASLDRNGLRPARFSRLKDGTVYMMSETGVIPNLDESLIVEKGRLGPGQMINVDLETGIFKDNLQIKSEIASRHPYGEWIAAQRRDVTKLPMSATPNFETSESDDSTITFAQASFGWGLEDIGMQIQDMAGSGKETTYSMGDDAPLAVLSERPHVLYNYLKQRFAQVTNPPIDPLREGVVMSLGTTLGKKESIYKVSELGARLIHLETPLVNEAELERIKEHASSELGGFQHATVSTRYALEDGPQGLEQALDNVCQQVVEEVSKGAEVVILSDKTFDKSELEETTYIPPLLAIGAVHHTLLAKGLRMDTGLIVETGSAWSTHHFACLVGYGANAIHPYLAFETVKQWHAQDKTQKMMAAGKLKSITVEEAQDNYRISVENGLLKILSKMGISLLTSYQGAQIFEAIGLSSNVIDKAFKRTTSRIGGMSFEDIASETIMMRPDATESDQKIKLVNYGYYKPVPKFGEYHVNSSDLARLLHKAIGLDKTVSSATNRDELPNDGVGEASAADYEIFQQSLKVAPLANIRDLLDFDVTSDKSIPIDEVEPVSEIMKRFCTGAMSLGALSREAHETLAIAVNRVGGKSNSGEGGEDVVRGKTLEDVDAKGRSPTFPHLAGLKNGDSANSFIHQVASGRFGVTPEFLVTAKQLEIKIAQGAKPGEGGQLPGQKVSDYIATLRASKPGVTLISPPPHHDIYSIEDLAQLIHDLHAINEKAGVSVKLVSSIGIGTVACGVAKANADVIQISGGDGGTGASPLSSIKAAGCPWELGLTEAHSALVKNGLRQRVILRADGGIRTGRDVIMAALMGAEEYGFGTIAMIAEGCIMARVCHLNTCPVGVTSQKEELRKKFPGTPEHVVNFFHFVAEETRQLMAHLGIRRMEDLIGRVDLLKEHSSQIERVAKTKGIDVGPFFASVPDTSTDRTFLDGSEDKLKKEVVHLNGFSSDLDRTISANKDVQKVISENKGECFLKQDIKNTDRSVCAMLSGDIARAHGNRNFRGNVNIEFRGSAGQSFGAFVLPGLYVKLIGEANDYVGKGMHGGEIVVVPNEKAGFVSADSSIVGNACLYGATGGDFHANGRAGERFAVRNSGAYAVAEGTGDHCCEYMTGGLVAILGSVGRNVGAGMTGGIGYFYDPHDELPTKLNREIVQMQRLNTPEGEAQLRAVIERHYSKTSSERAESILDNWETEKLKFYQVYPPSEASNPVVSSEKASIEAATTNGATTTKIVNGLRVSASAPDGEMCFLPVGTSFTPEQTARCAD